MIIICIGIPVAIVLALVLMIGALVAWVAAGRLIGERFLQVLSAGEQPPLLQILVGVSLISLLAQVSCMGPVFSILVLSWGLGGVVLTRFGMIAYPLEPDQAGTFAPTGGVDDMLEDSGNLTEQDHHGDTRRLETMSPEDWSDVEAP